MFTKRKQYCKGALQEEVNEEVKEEVTKTAKQPPKQKPTKTMTTITGDIVNTYIKENPDTVNNCLRNERVMKAQRKQMNARSSLNNACYTICFILYYIYIYIYIHIDIKHDG